MTTTIPLAVGQKWRHKRESWRTVEITALETWGSPPMQRAFVTRSTSRRRQAIKESTLRRDYKCVITDVRVARA